MTRAKVACTLGCPLTLTSPVIWPAVGHDTRQHVVRSGVSDLLDIAPTEATQSTQHGVSCACTEGQHPMCCHCRSAQGSLLMGNFFSACTGDRKTGYCSLHPQTILSSMHRAAPTGPAHGSRTTQLHMQYYAVHHRCLGARCSFTQPTCPAQVKDTQLRQRSSPNSSKPFLP